MSGGNFDLSSSPSKKYRKSNGKTCAVIGCSNSQRKRHLFLKGECDVHNNRRRLYCGCPDPFRFFNFPVHGQADKADIRQVWLGNIKRKNFTPSKSSVVCSEHFVEKKPTLGNPYPVLKMGHGERLRTPRPPPSREKRRPFNQVNASDCTEAHSNITIEVMDTEIMIPTHNIVPATMQPIPTVIIPAIPPIVKVGGAKDVTHDHNYSKPPHLGMVDVGTQTDFTPSDCLDNKKVKLYTGLQSQTMFLWIVQKLSSSLPVNKFQDLAVADQILLVLSRLKLGLLYEDLGYRFKITRNLASSICVYWIRKISNIFSPLLSYIPASLTQKLCPVTIRKRYPKLRCILDCFELFTERPLQLKTRAQMYSHYKSHQTVKYLVGVAPHGLITFLSDGFQGRISDLEITNKSGFLSKIEPNDQIMADRGFNIKDEVEKRGAKLAIPAFTRGKPQLSNLEVIKTRRIANSRIHVERAIRRIRTFRILHGNIPITQLYILDDIVRVISIICNLKPLLINDSRYSRKSYQRVPSSAVAFERPNSKVPGGDISTSSTVSSPIPMALSGSSSIRGTVQPTSSDLSGIFQPVVTMKSPPIILNPSPLTSRVPKILSFPRSKSHGGSLKSNKKTFPKKVTSQRTKPSNTKATQNSTRNSLLQCASTSTILSDEGPLLNSFAPQRASSPIPSNSHDLPLPSHISQPPSPSQLSLPPSPIPPRGRQGTTFPERIQSPIRVDRTTICTCRPYIASKSQPGFALDGTRHVLLLDKLQFQIVPNSGNGDCMFKMLSQILKRGNERYHFKIRNDVVSFILDSRWNELRTDVEQQNIVGNAELEANFSEDDKSTYNNLMRKRGTYSGLVELKAASELFKFNFVLVEEYNNNNCLTYRAQNSHLEECSVKHYFLFTGSFNSGHWQSLVPEEKCVLLDGTYKGCIT